MANSKAQLKNNGNTALPCFRPLNIKNAKQMFAYLDSGTGLILLALTVSW